MIRCSRGSARLFRNNCGQFKDKAGNWIRYGVGNPGGSDLLGWQQIKITPDDVGRVIAQFLAFEVKRPGFNETKEQKRFGEMVTKAGGKYAVVHSPEEAEESLLQDSNSPDI
jgi:hypothetical protein